MLLTKDLAGGVVASTIGTLYLYFATHIRSSPLADTVGPAGLPKGLGIFMILLGAVLCAQSLYRSLCATGFVPGEWIGVGRRTLRGGGLLALAMAYLVVISWLGYALSIAILITLAARYQGAMSSWRLPLIGASGALVLWLIFDRLLGIAMPTGTFW